MNKTTKTSVQWNFEEKESEISPDHDSRHCGPLPVKIHNFREIVFLNCLTFQRQDKKCAGSAKFSAREEHERFGLRCQTPFDRLASKDLIYNQLSLRGNENEQTNFKANNATVCFEFSLVNSVDFLQASLNLFEALIQQLQTTVPILDMHHPHIFQEDFVLMGHDDGSGPVYWPLGKFLFQKKF